MNDRLIVAAVADKLLGRKRYACTLCEFQTDDIEELNGISDLTQRVFPGEFMPSGECVKCGALIECSDQDIVAVGNEEACVGFLQRLGYTVTPP